VARRLALVGGMTLLLPVIQSIVAPTAAEAATCITDLDCEVLIVCPNTACCGTPGSFCARLGISCECQQR